MNQMKLIVDLLYDGDVIKEIEALFHEALICAFTYKNVRVIKWHLVLTNVVFFQLVVCSYPSAVLQCYGGMVWWPCCSTNLPSFWSQSSKPS